MPKRVAMRTVALLGCLLSAVVTMAATSPDAAGGWASFPPFGLTDDPYAPGLVNPCNGANYIVGDRVTFAWHRISAASSYTMTLYNIGGGGSVIMPGITDTTISLPMEFQQSYQWDVYSTRPGAAPPAPPPPVQSQHSGRCGFTVSSAP